MKMIMAIKRKGVVLFVLAIFSILVLKSMNCKIEYDGFLSECKKDWSRKYLEYCSHKYKILYSDSDTKLERISKH